MEIRGKVILITGASDGIGAACARAFRERGALLALTGRSPEKLSRAAVPGDLTVAADLTAPGAPSRVVDAVLERYGRIDILVNNAGAGLYMPSWQAPLDSARSLFELNFFAPLNLIQLAVPGMRQRGSGMIVNVSSIAGKMTLPWFTLYSAGKYALCSLSDGLRMELAGSGVHVMTVCPGYVNTAFQSHIIGGQVPEKIASSRRFAITVEECARSIVRGVERNSRTVVTPRSGWLLIAFARLFPRVMDAQLAKLNRQSEGSRPR